MAQKLLRTRRTFQHLLPVNSTGLGRASVASLAAGKGEDGLDGTDRRRPSSRSVVAEAVNVISLDALFGLLRMYVILRGDAVPLADSERSDCEEKLRRNLTKERGGAAAAENDDVGGSGKGDEVGVDDSASLSPRAVRAFFDPPRVVLQGRFGRGGGDC